MICQNVVARKLVVVNCTHQPVEKENISLLSSLTLHNIQDDATNKAFNIKNPSHCMITRIAMMLILTSQSEFHPMKTTLGMKRTLKYKSSSRRLQRKKEKSSCSLGTSMKLKFSQTFPIDDSPFESTRGVDNIQCQKGNCYNQTKQNIRNDRLKK